jgi:hypothetical protein
MAIDQIFFGWKEFFKFILEVSTVILPLRFVVHFLSSGFLLSVGLPLILLASMLAIMWFVEKQMFEITRGIRNGKIWLQKSSK